MSKVCQITGKKPMFGNNVSHANNKTRRKFNVNLQKKRLIMSLIEIQLYLNMACVHA